MKRVKYLTVFLGDEAMALEARAAVDSQLATGWEIYETLNLGIGTDATSNRTQIQLLHVLLKDVEDAPSVAGEAKRGRPAKVDA